MANTRESLPDIFVPTVTTPSDALSSLTKPLLASNAAEKILSPDEAFDKAFAEIRECVKAHGWDAAAMFLGTGVYMGVYYADAYFEVFGPVGHYVVHNLAMGMTANLSVLPLVRQGRLHEGKTPAQANRDAFRYFLLCSMPDSLYQPVEDWFIAMGKSGSMIHFDFVYDAVAEFSPAEIAASFALFGVGFGLLYLIMKKLLIKHDDEPEAAVQEFDDNWQKLYKSCRTMMQTPTWEAVKSALQYFIFYLSDYVFDLSMDGATKTLLNLFGCCTLMAGYSFVFDNLPELFAYLEIRRARTLGLQALQEQPESLDSDYVNVTDVPDVEDDNFTVLGGIVDRLVEPSIQQPVNATGLSHHVTSTTSIASLDSSQSEAGHDYSSRVSSDDEQESLSQSRVDASLADDFEVIDSNVANEVDKPKPTDPNNILPYSAQLLKSLGSIANSAIKQLPSNAINDAHALMSGVSFRSV